MKQKLKTNWLKRQPLDTIISHGVVRDDHGELFSLGLELLDKGLKLSDSWLLSPDFVFGGPIDPHRSYAAYLGRFRLMDEVLDGLTTNNLVTTLADGC